MEARKRLNLQVTRPDDDPRRYGIETEGTELVGFGDPFSDPDITVKTDEQTFQDIYTAVDPKATAMRALKNGQIRFSGNSLGDKFQAKLGERLGRAAAKNADLTQYNIGQDEQEVVEYRGGRGLLEQSPLGNKMITPLTPSDLEQMMPGATRDWPDIPSFVIDEVGNCQGMTKRGVQRLMASNNSNLSKSAGVGGISSVPSGSDSNSISQSSHPKIEGFGLRSEGPHLGVWFKVRDPGQSLSSVDVQWDIEYGNPNASTNSSLRSQNSVTITEPIGQEGSGSYARFNGAIAEGFVRFVKHYLNSVTQAEGSITIEATDGEDNTSTQSGRRDWFAANANSRRSSSTQTSTPTPTETPGPSVLAPEIRCLQAGVWHKTSTGQTGTKIGITWDIRDPDDNLASVRLSGPHFDANPFTRDVNLTSTGSFVEFSSSRCRGRVAIAKLTVGASQTIDDTYTIEATDAAGNVTRESKHIGPREFNVGSNTDLGCSGEPPTSRNIEKH